MSERQPSRYMQDVLSSRDGSLTIEKWLTSKEAAEYLRITEGALRNMVCLRKVRYSKLGGRNRFLLDDLRQLLVPPKHEEETHGN